MANWKEYTTKTTPEDADEIMIADSKANVSKRTPFSGLWNWIAGKLATAVISRLETQNKSIIPAINELSSNGIYNVNPDERARDFFSYKTINRTANSKKIIIQANKAYADIAAIIFKRKEIYFLRANCNGNGAFTSCDLVNTFNNQSDSLQGEIQDGKIQIPIDGWENVAIIIKCNALNSFVTLSVE